MNDRIRELAEQAGYKPLPGFDFANSLQEVFIKKFAKLIIEKCGDIANDYVDHGIPSSAIDKYFGVDDEMPSM